MKQLESPSDAKLVSLMKIYDLGGEVHLVIDMKPMNFQRKNRKYQMLLK